MVAAAWLSRARRWRSGWVKPACSFSPSRAGEHARNFLFIWNCKLVCDDFAGYKASFELGITEIGFMAYARRKFFDLHVANIAS